MNLCLLRFLRNSEVSFDKLCRNALRGKQFHNVTMVMRASRVDSLALQIRDQQQFASSKQQSPLAAVWEFRESNVLAQGEHSQALKGSTNIKQISLLQRVQQPLRGNCSVLRLMLEV